MASSASDIRAGGAWYELYGRDSLTPVFERAKAGALKLTQYMKALPVVGGPLDTLAKRLAPVAHLATTVGASVRRAFTNGMTAVNSLAGGLARVGAALGAVGAAGVAAFKPAISAISELGRQGDMAAALGIGAERFTGLAAAFERFGIDAQGTLDVLTDVADWVQDAAQNGGSLADTFALMGLNVQKLVALKPDQQFAAIAEALSRIDPTLAAGLAARLGGDFQKLLPLLRQGSAAVDDLVAKLGTAAADVRAAQEANRAYTEATAELARVWREVGAAIAPALASLARLVADALKPVVEWVRENRALVAVGLAAAGALVAVGAAAATLAVGLAATVTVIGALIAGWKILLGMFLVATQIAQLAALAAGVAAAVYALAEYTETGREVAGQIKGELKPALDQARTAFQAFANAVQKGDFGAAWEVAAAGAELVWAGLVDRLTRLWHRAVAEFHEIFGGIGEAFEALYREVVPVLRRVLADVRQVLVAIRAAFDQRVEEIARAWEQIREPVMKVVEAIKPALAVLAAPFVAAVGLIEAAWDGLDKNILITLTRLAKTVAEVWERIVGAVEGAAKKIAVAVLESVTKVIEPLGKIDVGFSTTKALESITALRKELEKPVDVEARVRAVGQLYKDLETDLRNKQDAARKAREAGNAKEIEATEGRVAEAQKRLDAAMGRANEPRAPGAPDAARMPDLRFSIPNVSVKGTSTTAMLAQQLGYGDQLSKQTDLMRQLVAGEGGLPAAIGRAVAESVMRVGN